MSLTNFIAQLGASGAGGGDKATIAYVASQNSDDITAIDISNPSSMSELGSFTSANLNGPQDIAVDVENEVAYLVSFNSDDVTSVDISDPSSMSELNSISYPGFFNGAIGIAIDVAAQYAFVAAKNDSRISSVDISNPSSLDTDDLIDDTDTGGATGVAIDLTNSYVYLAAFTNRKFVSIEYTPSTGNMTKRDVLGSGDGINEPKRVALDVENEVAYLVHADGLMSVDISTPTAMSVLDTIDGSANGVLQIA